MINFLFYWAPRVHGLAFGVFLCTFAFDVFGEGIGFWRTTGAFLLHLIPALIAFVALAIAWRWERVGALLFVGLGLLYIAWSWGSPPGWFFAVAGPSIVTGLLFLASWIWKRRMTGRATSKEDSHG